MLKIDCSHFCKYNPLPLTLYIKYWLYSKGWHTHNFIFNLDEIATAPFMLAPLNISHLFKNEQMISSLILHFSQVITWYPKTTLFSWSKGWKKKQLHHCTKSPFIKKICNRNITFHLLNNEGKLDVQLAILCTLESTRAWINRRCAKHTQQAEET